MVDRVDDNSYNYSLYYPWDTTDFRNFYLLQTTNQLPLVSLIYNMLFFFVSLRMLLFFNDATLHYAFNSTLLSVYNHSLLSVKRTHSTKSVWGRQTYVILIKWHVNTRDNLPSAAIVSVHQRNMAAPKSQHQSQAAKVYNS